MLQDYYTLKGMELGETNLDGKNAATALARSEMAAGRRREEEWAEEEKKEAKKVGEGGSWAFFKFSC